MKFCRQTFLVKFFLALMLSGAATASPVISTTTDAQNAPFPCRFGKASLIALAPNIAEMIDHLGKRGQLRGVASRDAWSKSEDIADIGSFIQPDIERLLALKPELILSLEGASPSKLLSQLHSRNIPVFHLRLDSLQDMKEAYTKLGCLFQEKERANSILQKFDATFAGFQKEIQKKKNPDLAAPLLLLSTKPLMGINTKTYTASVIEALGLQPMSLPFKKKYPEINKEWLITSKPSVVFAFCGHDPKTKNTVSGVQTLHLSHPAWVRPSINILQAIPELIQQL